MEKFRTRACCLVCTYDVDGFGDHPVDFILHMKDGKALTYYYNIRRLYQGPQDIDPNDVQRIELVCMCGNTEDVSNYFVVAKDHLGLKVMRGVTNGGNGKDV